MPLFPLDAVRNAAIDLDVELILEDVREEIARFPFEPSEETGDVNDMLEVYDLARPRFNVITSLLRPLAGGCGADISTGLGFLPVVLARFDLTVTATEEDTALAHFAREHGIEVRPYCLGTSPPPFEPESLDFVVFAEVLEHLKLPPVRVLGELAALLCPGGRLVLTTPNIARLHHIETLLAGENFLEPFDEAIPVGRDATDFIEHVREYSVREVVEAVEAAGLAIDQVLMTGWGEAGYHPLANPYVNEIVVITAVR